MKDLLHVWFIDLVIYFVIVVCIDFCLNNFADKSEESCIGYYERINGIVLDGCEVHIENYKENLKESE